MAPRLDLQSKSYPTQASTKSKQEYQLSLKKVIGTTTLSSREFDCTDDPPRFAICAGCTVVLGEVDETRTVTQRFFRARPSVQPINLALSFYSTASPGKTPERRSRLRDGGSGLKSTGSPHTDHGDSPGKGVARLRARAATSVALSGDGKFLAVGEVRETIAEKSLLSYCRLDTILGS